MSASKYSVEVSFGKPHVLEREPRELRACLSGAQLRDLIAKITQDHSAITILGRISIFDDRGGEGGWVVVFPNDMTRGVIRRLVGRGIDLDLY